MDRATGDPGVRFHLPVRLEGHSKIQGRGDALALEQEFGCQCLCQAGGLPERVPRGQSNKMADTLCLRQLCRRPGRRFVRFPQRGRRA